MANTPQKVHTKTIDVPVTQKVEVIDWAKMDTDIVHAGHAITLPEYPVPMPIEEAIKALQQRLKDDNQTYNVHEVVDAYWHDGAVAFYRAVVELYGIVSPQTMQTFFGPKPPQMLSVRIGPKLNQVVQVPLGMFKLPGVDEPVYTEFQVDNRGQPVFLIRGEVKKKQRQIVLDLAQKTRELVFQQSIYRGKPVRLGVNDDGGLLMDVPPEFLDVSDITEADVLFDDNIKDQINTNILVPMKETSRCVQLGIPLKRGVLLEGPFGTGKSLTARMAAMVAEQYGWTFVLLDDVKGLRVALEFAKRYAPAIVFAEDIDRIASERDDEMNNLVNMIDGVISKGTQVMTILTTNYVEKLSPVILRPGRLDAVISIRAPSPSTVQKLLRYYGKGLIEEGEDLTNAGKELAGQIPASIRECVERAKLAMVGRQATTLSDHDLVITAQTMKAHLELLNKKEKQETAAETLARGLKKVIGNGHADGDGLDLDDLSGQIEGASDNAAAAYRKTRELERTMREAAEAANRLAMAQEEANRIAQVNDAKSSKKARA